MRRFHQNRYQKPNREGFVRLEPMASERLAAHGVLPSQCESTGFALSIKAYTEFLIRLFDVLQLVPESFEPSLSQAPLALLLG